MVETMKGLQQRVQDPPLQLQGEGAARGALPAEQGRWLARSGWSGGSLLLTALS